MGYAHLQGNIESAVIGCQISSFPIAGCLIAIRFVFVIDQRYCGEDHADFTVDENVRALSDSSIFVAITRYGLVRTFIFVYF